MKISNKVPMYIAVQLEKEDKRIWLPLPVTITQFQTALERIGAQDGNFIIRDYATKVPKISKSALMEAPLGMVNYLASRLSRLTDNEVIKLCAICDSEYAFGYIESYIDFTYQLGSYTLLPGVTDEEALGEYYIRRPSQFFMGAKQKHCIGCREFGRRMAKSENGAFTPHGYLTSKIGWNKPPKKRHIPDFLNIKGCIGENLFGDQEDELSDLMGPNNQREV